MFCQCVVFFQVKIFESQFLLYIPATSCKNISAAVSFHMNYLSIFFSPQGDIVSSFISPLQRYRWLNCILLFIFIPDWKCRLKPYCINQFRTIILQTLNLLFETIVIFHLNVFLSYILHSSAQKSHEFQDKTFISRVYCRLSIYLKTL